MIVDLRPQHARATLMLVVGVALLGFCAWGYQHPELFEAHMLPIMAGVAGALFIAVALALRTVRPSVERIELRDGELIITERGEQHVLGLAGVERSVVVGEPLGRGHPLLCLVTEGGGLLELALLRDEVIESVVAVINEELPSVAEPSVVVEDAATLCATKSGLQSSAGERWSWQEVAAIDFVQSLSVHGPGFVVHCACEPLPTGANEAIEPAGVMRRVAEGHFVPLPAAHISRAAALRVALHLERRRTMMF